MKEKSFVQTLISGGYIRKRVCRRKGYNHGLYNSSHQIVCNVSDTTMSSYSTLFKERKGITTLNLNLVRQRHGNSLVKTLYKKSKKQSNAAS